MSKRVLYSCITSQYDEYRDNYHDGLDWILFTNNPETYVPNCDVRLIRSSDDKIRTASRFKILSHQWLQGYEYSIWLDGSLKLLHHPNVYIDLFMGDADLAAPVHFERDCIYAEAEELKHWRLDGAEVIDEQMQRYRNEGFPEHWGLIETGCLIRRHTKETQFFNEFWWEECCKGSRRDQLSAMYSLWKTGLKFVTLPGRGTPASSIFKFLGHRT
jgi:hypothetical protein